MAHALPSRRRSMVMALLATTAAASLLGGCGQTGGLFSRGQGPEEVQMTAGEAAEATTQWAKAYAENPRDADTALGYATALRALGSKERAMEVLSSAYHVNPTNGLLAAELGRAALESGRIDIASRALKSAESQGIDDWRTLSAQGTLHAKRGKHAEAQKYYQAALEKEPDSLSVINNLALSYALDGQAAKAEELLRTTMDSGQDDKRIRQNLALVLGVQGKLDEAKQVASVDMSDVQAKTSMSYIQNMMSKPEPAKTEPAKTTPEITNDDWSPFGLQEPAAPVASPPVHTVAHTPAKPSIPKVQVVKPIDEVTTPGNSAPQLQAPAPATSPLIPAVAKTTAPAPQAKVFRVPDKPVIVKQMAAKTATAAQTATRKAASTKAPKPRTKVVLEIAPPNQSSTFAKTR